MAQGVFAKDVILHIIGELGADYGVYKVIEFTGPMLKELSISERMALCNMTTEMGAKAAYIQPDEVTMEYVRSRVKGEYTIFETDADYQYAATFSYDVTSIKPQVAAPSSVDNVFDLAQYAGTAVQQAYLGSCTGGRVDDIAVAARILKGKKIHPRTRFIIVPASKEVLLQAMEQGWMQMLVSAGATFVTPGCAACLGTHEGMIASLGAFHAWLEGFIAGPINALENSRLALPIPSIRALTQLIRHCVQDRLLEQLPGELRQAQSSLAAKRAGQLAPGINNELVEQFNTDYAKAELANTTFFCASVALFSKIFKNNFALSAIDSPPFISSG